MLLTNIFGDCKCEEMNSERQIFGEGWFSQPMDSRSGLRPPFGNDSDFLLIMAVVTRE